MVWMSTSYSRQFSSPPVSCTYSRWRPSCAQPNCRMPRSVSSVTTRAAARSTPSCALTGASHTFSTPSWGAIQASWVPSGEMVGLDPLGVAEQDGQRNELSHSSRISLFIIYP